MTRYELLLRDRDAARTRAIDAERCDRHPDAAVAWAQVALLEKQLGEMPLCEAVQIIREETCQTK